MGLMAKLMKQSLTEMRENGQSLSLLYPYSIPLYRRKGWEIVSDKMSYRLRDVQLPKNLEVPGYVRRVSWENADFMDLPAQFAKQTHGCIFRNNLAWDEYWRWDEDDTTVAIYYREDGSPRGYMVYLLKDDIMFMVSDGKAVVEEGESEHSAAMTIGTLTTLMLGYKRAFKLEALEKIEAEPETLHLLDYAFIYKKPYISDYI